MKLAKSPGYSNHAAAIGSHADYWLISSVRTILLNTKITHRLQIIDVDAQAARGPGPCAAHFRTSQVTFSSHAGMEETVLT